MWCPLNTVPNERGSSRDLQSPGLFRFFEGPDTMLCLFPGNLIHKTKLGIRISSSCHEVDARALSRPGAACRSEGQFLTVVPAGACIHDNRLFLQIPRDQLRGNSLSGIHPQYARLRHPASDSFSVRDLAISPDVASGVPRMHPIPLTIGSIYVKTGSGAHDLRSLVREAFRNCLFPGMVGTIG